MQVACAFSVPAAKQLGHLLLGLGRSDVSKAAGLLLGGVDSSLGKLQNGSPVLGAFVVQPHGSKAPEHVEELGPSIRNCNYGVG